MNANEYLWFQLLTCEISFVNDWDNAKIHASDISRNHYNLPRPIWMLMTKRSISFLCSVVGVYIFSIVFAFKYHYHSKVHVLRIVNLCQCLLKVRKQRLWQYCFPVLWTGCLRRKYGLLADYGSVNKKLHKIQIKFKAE